MNTEVKGEEIRAVRGNFGGDNGAPNNSVLEQIGRYKTSMGSPYNILRFTIGTAADVTREGVVYGLNLIWWGILFF